MYFRIFNKVLFIFQDDEPPIKEKDKSEETNDLNVESDDKKYYKEQHKLSTWIAAGQSSII